jgi:hypothetical protein
MKKSVFFTATAAIMILAAACGQNASKKERAEQSGDALLLTQTCLVDYTMVLQDELGFEVEEIMLYFHDMQERFKKELGIETVNAHKRNISYKLDNGKDVTIDLKLALAEKPFTMLLYKKGTAPIFLDAIETDMEQVRRYLGNEVTDVVALPDAYADLPDKDFPIPMIDGKIVPHDWMRPPEEHDVSTFYGYTGKDLMKSYQAQLREAGFLDQGNAGRVESLWIYERSEDGATLVVELGYNKEEKTTVIGMYVNYLHRDEEALIRPQKLNESDIPGEIGYQLDFVEGYRYTDKTGENIVFATEGGVMEWGEDDDGVTLSNKDLRAYRFLKVDGQWEEVWRVYDMEFECKNNPVAEFVAGAFSITDLDNDGVAEIWLLYIKSCKGGDDPDNMFLRMYADEEVYTLTGKTRLVLSDGSVVGGEYAMDDNFLNNNTPSAFVDYAKSLWEKHIQGK